MSYLLDVIGSFAIGAVVMLLIIRFNETMLNASNESLIYNLAQFNTTELSQIIEYDFYKIGFRVDSEEKFAETKESDITYYSDYGNNGSVDTIRYYLSDTSALSNTTNPKDKILYRTMNGGDQLSIGSVVVFELAYLDSAGTEITPISKLTDPDERKKIRGIDVHIYIESEFPIANEYQGAEWRKKLILKNIY
jgi:hypothetical protein